MATKRFICALLMPLSIAAAVQAAHAAPLAQTVHGYRVELSVEAVSGSDEYRVSVQVRSARLSHPVQLESASLHIAERGHGQVIPLSLMGSGDGAFYEARVRMASKGPYRIVVHATPTGRRRAIEAQFKYGGSR